MGLGEGYRQSQANEQRAIEEQLRNKAATTQSEAVTMDESCRRSSFRYL